MYHSASSIDELAPVAPLLEHPSVCELHLHLSGSSHSAPDASALRCYPLPSPEGFPRAPVHSVNANVPSTMKDVSTHNSEMSTAPQFIPTEDAMTQLGHSSPEQGDMSSAEIVDEPMGRMRGGEKDSHDGSIRNDSTLRVWLAEDRDKGAGASLLQHEAEAAREGAVKRLPVLADTWSSLFVWIGSWAASFWTLVCCCRCPRMHSSALCSFSAPRCGQQRIVFTLIAACCFQRTILATDVKIVLFESIVCVWNSCKLAPCADAGGAVVQWQCGGTGGAAGWGAT